MTKVKLDWFEETIDINSLEEVYEAKLDIDGKETWIELCFEEFEKCDENVLEPVNPFIKNFADIRKRTNEKIAEDFKNKGVVRDLIEDHLEQFDKDEKKVLGIDENSMSKEEQINQIFSNIYLKRVGIYPGVDETFAIFDYSINPDLTQYVFVIETDCFGKIISDKVFIES